MNLRDCSAALVIQRREGGFVEEMDASREEGGGGSVALLLLMPSEFLYDHFSIHLAGSGVCQPLLQRVLSMVEEAKKRVSYRRIYYRPTS